MSVLVFSSTPAGRKALAEAIPQRKEDTVETLREKADRLWEVLASLTAKIDVARDEWATAERAAKAEAEEARINALVEERLKAGR